ncbi:MAG: hypothetical protein E7355_04065 [Clostridiales bacterium]|nr:hypothetical protein [Clostridiales bacterium]
MKIQILGNNQTKINSIYKISYLSLSQPISFDLFDVNIIDLQDENLWRNDGRGCSTINDIGDFKSLHEIIKNSKHNILIALPQNYTFKYDKFRDSYSYEEKLKDMIGDLKKIFEELFPKEIKNRYNLIYENSITNLKNSSFSSAFCFTNLLNLKNKTIAEGSKRATTIQLKENLFITTLKLRSPKGNLDELLLSLGLVEQRQIVPQWLIDFECFNDKEQKDKSARNKEKIQKLNEEINQANEILNQNLYYKTVLTETGEPLVKIVFEMLGRLLNYDLSHFADKKDEDFRITIDDSIFIGEIKGINTNVKKVNVSQVDTHCKNCEDEFEDETKKVKGLLVINHQRDKNITEREAVNPNTISLAEKYEILIIPTIDLLRIYEQYIAGELTTERIIDQFKKQTGLIDISKI